ncbi:MAG: hypothetical protein RI990_715 [Planctomycetota bacterium]
MLLIVACLAVDPPVDAARILGVGESAAVTADVGVWVPRLTGTAQVGSGGTSFNLDQDLSVQSSAPGVAGEFAVTVDRWKFGGLGFEASTSGTGAAPSAGNFGGVAIAAGDIVRGSYSSWMAGAEVGYVVWRPFADEPWPWSEPGDNRARAEASIGRNGRPLVDLQVQALGGVMAFHYAQTVENVTAGGTADFDRTAFCVYGGGGLDLRIGMDGRIPLIQDLRLYGNAGIGGGWPGADSVWMIRVGIAAMIDEHVGIEFGYRLFDFTLVDGPSQVDAGLRGLFGAVSLRF